MTQKVVLLLVCLGLFFSERSFAHEIVFPSVFTHVTDKARLQRGAKFFVNYCSGCHSLKYMRYNRMAEDLGLTQLNGETDVHLLNNLIFTQATQYGSIRIAMSPADAKRWFGIVPPDLSLSARERGATWLYNYLKSFYTDNSRPFGANNLLVPNVAMPNILEPLIGQMILVSDKKTHESSLLLIKQGEMPPRLVDEALQDLVTFLVYVGEPAKLVRYYLGVFVIIFLCVLFFIMYRLKLVYWRRLEK